MCYPRRVCVCASTGAAAEALAINKLAKARRAGHRRERWVTGLLFSLGALLAVGGLMFAVVCYFVTLNEQASQRSQLFLISAAIGSVTILPGNLLCAASVTPTAARSIRASFALLWGALVVGAIACLSAVAYAAVDICSSSEPLVCAGCMLAGSHSIPDSHSSLPSTLSS